MHYIYAIIVITKFILKFTLTRMHYIYAIIVTKIFHKSIYTIYLYTYLLRILKSMYSIICYKSI